MRSVCNLNAYIQNVLQLILVLQRILCRCNNYGNKTILPLSLSCKKRLSFNLQNRFTSIIQKVRQFGAYSTQEATEKYENTYVNMLLNLKTSFTDENIFLARCWVKFKQGQNLSPSPPSARYVGSSYYKKYSKADFLNSINYKILKIQL